MITNSIPYTLKLDALGQFSLEPIIEKKLMDDQIKVLESAAGDQFVATELVAVNIGTASCNILTTGTATDTAGANITAYNTRYIVDYMKRNLIPGFSGRDYVCVASVNALSGMHADTGAGGWQEISKYTGEFARNIFNGEVGRFYKTKFVEETGYLSNTIGTGSVFGAAVFMGSDTVYEAVAIPEEIRVKQSNDYGRDQGLAWYALLGFQIVWAYATDAEQHIVYVTSA